MTTQQDSIAKDIALTDRGTYANGQGAMNNDKPLHLMDTEQDPEKTLERLKSLAASHVTLTSEAFEKLYLQPRLKGTKHPLAKVFGNPTPL